MTKTAWGALPSEWGKLIKLKLHADLLPVVSNPNAEVAAYSTMKTIGKTPSQYNNRGQVVGIGKWTQQRSHINAVRSWREEPTYGICLQTRNVRALDIDVRDEDKAIKICDFIADWLGFTLPLRYRGDSSKCLFAFRLKEGEDIGKRTVAVGEHKGQKEMIEFLATGQQFIAAGTHPDGARYEWSWNEHKDFPTLTEDQFEDLWFVLCEEFGTEAPTQRGVRNKSAHDYDKEHSDHVSEFLIENGHTLGQGVSGEIYIECPFSDGHSTEDNGTSTAYFPAGSGGYERGHFVCLHASCEHRTDEDFWDAYDIRKNEFEVVELAEEEAALELPRYKVDKFGQPKAILDNVCMAVERPDILGMMPRYDEFRDEIIFYDPTGKKWKREGDALFIGLRRHLEKAHGFYPIGREMMRDAVLEIATKNKVDTAIEWLKSLKWDGRERLDTFLSEYMGCDDTPYTRAVSRYMWSALAGRVVEPGVKADMIPVLKSPEGYKKSSSIEAMAPSPDEFVEIDFSVSDADIARKVRGKMVAEVAELRGLRTREVEGILAWATRRFEEWIPKYREFSTKFPRRFIAIATTNEDEFLDGVRKHRRWLPAEVKTDADVDAIRRDRKQLWAEALVLFEKHGVMYAEADKLGDAVRDQFRIKSVWEDVISTWLNMPDGMDEEQTPAERPYVLGVDVARFALNLDPARMKRADEMKIADSMKAIGYASKRVWDDTAGKQIRAWVKNGR